MAERYADDRYGHRRNDAREEAIPSIMAERATRSIIRKARRVLVQEFKVKVNHG